MLILWSGGCDSTLLLARMLEQETDVRTLSIVHPDVPNSRTVQHGVRERIIDHFCRKHKRKWCHGEVTVAHMGYAGFQAEPPPEGGGGIVQPHDLAGLGGELLAAGREFGHGMDQR